jgi:hypothetical protein
MEGVAAVTRETRAGGQGVELCKAAGGTELCVLAAGTALENVFSPRPPFPISLLHRLLDGNREIDRRIVLVNL